MSDYEQTSAFLAAHLDADRFSDPRYLDWLYGANPRGRAIDENIDDETGRRIAHYAVLPTRFRTPAGSEPFIFTCNVATDPGARKRGLFREMADRIYPRAAATGAAGMVGSANAQSAAVIVDRFGWYSFGPTPVVATVPVVLPRGIEDHVVDQQLLEGNDLDTLGADLDWVPVRDWVQSWTPDFLRWRLSRPDATYCLHVAPDALAVSTRFKGPLGVPAAVLLKIFPRPNARLPVRTARLVAAACRAQRAPVCVYAGWNAHARVRGVPVPVRLRPSPLVIVYKSFDDRRAPQGAFRVDTYELLDADGF